MLIGYMRVSKSDGSQTVDLQRDALIAANVNPTHIYEDRASDRLGRDLRHLINTVHDLTKRGIGFKVLTGHGASIDTTTPAGIRHFCCTR
jgi:DNA invertase Pin-like site-specific DNA recombinase